MGVFPPLTPLYAQYLDILKGSPRRFLIYLTGFRGGKYGVSWG